MGADESPAEPVCILQQGDDRPVRMASRHVVRRPLRSDGRFDGRIVGDRQLRFREPLLQCRAGKKSQERAATSVQDGPEFAIDAFISNLTAVIIVTILLFTLSMISSKDERLMGFMPAGSGRVLNICVAMFLVAAFSHIDIRRKIAAEEIFHPEHFYFLIYVTMLWKSINSVPFAMGTNSRLIDDRNNLPLKLLCWPFLPERLFAVTVLTSR